MNKIQLYDVNAEYLEALYKIDTEIRVSKEQLRPYLFTKIKIENKDYLIPLSSPKTNKPRAKDIVDTIYDNKRIIGFLEYHKMIPFHDKIATPIKIADIQDINYRQLLLKDYRYIANDLGFEHVQDKASLIYNARYNPDHYLFDRYLNKMGTDVNKLEKYLDKYIDRLNEIDNIEIHSKQLIQEILIDNNIDPDIVMDIKVYGSFSKLEDTTESDIDVLVSYSGDLREDDLFNVLNTSTNNIFNERKIDFNPIHPEKSGTIEQYLKHIKDPGIKKKEVAIPDKAATSKFSVSGLKKSQETIDRETKPTIENKKTITK